MSMNINDAPKGSGKQSPIPEADTHIGVVIQVIGLGLQPGGEWDGQPKPDKKKVRITFELPEQTAEFDGEEKPLIISKEYNFSNHEKAPLVALLNTLDPKNETKGDLTKLLGKACLVTVAHREGKGKHQGKVFANLAGVTALPKIIPAPEGTFNPLVSYDPYDHDDAVFGDLPEFIQDKISTRLDAPANAVAQESKDDEEPPFDADPDTSGEW